MLQGEVAKTGARGVCMGWGLKPGHSREVKKKKTKQKEASNLWSRSVSNPSPWESLGALESHMVQPLPVGASCCALIDYSLASHHALFPHGQFSCLGRHEKMCAQPRQCAKGSRNKGLLTSPPGDPGSLTDLFL